MTKSEDNNNREVVNLQSPLFTRARNGLSNAIVGLINQLYTSGSASGEINMKMVIELKDEFVPAPEREPDINGNVKYGQYLYKTLIISHQITHTIKHSTKYPNDKIEADGMELTRDEEGTLIFVPVMTSQMKLETEN